MTDRKEQKRAWYEANKERIATQAKAYREANKEKIAERNQVYREANPDKEAARNKAYQEANREKINARNRARYQANKEQKAEYQRQYRAANKERLAERDKAYNEATRERKKAWTEQHYAKFPEKIREARKKWAKANPNYHNDYLAKRPGYVKVRSANQRAKKYGRPGKLTVADWDATLELFNHKCGLCGCTEDLTLDHIIPLVHPDATNHPESIGVLCYSCNASKKDTLIEYGPYREVKAA